MTEPQHQRSFDTVPYQKAHEDLIRKIAGAGGGTGVAVLHSWHWDDEVETLIESVDFESVCTLDPDGLGAGSGDTLRGSIQMLSGNSFEFDPIPLDAPIAVADVESMIQDLIDSSPQFPYPAPTFSITGEDWDGLTGPLVWTITGNMLGSITLSVDIDEENHQSNSITTYGQPPEYGFYYDSGDLPEGTMITSLYPVITEDFVFDGDSRTVEAVHFNDPGRLNQEDANEVWNGGYNCAVQTPNLVSENTFKIIEDIPYAGLIRVNSFGEEYTLTAGAVDFVATYITLPNTPSLSIPTNDYWSD